MTIMPPNLTNPHRYVDVNENYLLFSISTMLMACKICFSFIVQLTLSYLLMNTFQIIGHDKSAIIHASNSSISPVYNISILNSHLTQQLIIFLLTLISSYYAFRWINYYKKIFTFLFGISVLFTLWPCCCWWWWWRWWL